VCDFGGVCDRNVACGLMSVISKSFWENVEPKEVSDAGLELLKIIKWLQVQISELEKELADAQDDCEYLDSL
jgi:hypothetical protein